MGTVVSRCGPPLPGRTRATKEMGYVRARSYFCATVGRRAQTGEGKGESAGSSPVQVHEPRILCRTKFRAARG